MTNQRTKSGFLFWMLAALLLAAALLRLAVGFSQLEDAGYAGRWSMELASEITVQAADPPEDGYADRDYYRVSFTLANHSQRPVELDGYSFDARPLKGDDWAARFEAVYSSSDEYQLRPQLPQGCTGPVELLLCVDPQEMQGSVLELVFEDYSGDILLGQITLP